MPTLPIINAQILQKLSSRLGFNEFGNSAHAGISRDRSDRLNHGSSQATRFHMAADLSGDLDHFGPNFVHQLKVGVALAKIVNRQLEPTLTKRTDRSEESLVVPTVLLLG